jgi:hypothetical protein
MVFSSDRKTDLVHISFSRKITSMRSLMLTKISKYMSENGPVLHEKFNENMYRQKLDHYKH